MKSSLLPVVGAAALGFAAAALLFASAAPRPARAQFQAPAIGQPIGGLTVAGPPSSPAPQPIEIEALDGQHFVVATREPRLVIEEGKENVAVNMLVTVVTHYTVRGDRLFPVEHVRVPPRYQLVPLGEPNALR